MKITSKILVLTCTAVLSITNTIAQQSQKVDLTKNWSFKAHEPEQDIVTIIPKIAQWMIAQVPGVVHTDLMANKVIEDPFFGENERKMQWVGEQEWHYQTVFEPSADFLAQQNQELVFEGLDTYAEVYLNDKLILTADNMFIEWRVDVKSKLLRGSNHLLIKFIPTYARGMEVRREHGYQFLLPADNDKGNVKTSIYTRKAPYHFGWDWGPRFLTVGLWRPVYLEGWSWARLDRVHFEQQPRINQDANFAVNLNVKASRPGSVWIKIVDQHNNQYYNAEAKVQYGDNKVKAKMTIRNPKLWWPNGSGEPNLYPTKVIVSRTNGGTPVDVYETNIGVRTIELVQEDDAVGKSFYFRVNGEPIFARGANYIPQDVFLPRVAKEDYEEFIDMCVKSNFNMLRVWGGGIYENDYFYELCDKAGIMVWQDFMFSCSLYPWSEEFLANVEKEVRYNVRRLINHPSIALWCGNNEISELWYNWGYQKKYSWNKAQQAEILAGMEKLFNQHIPAILAQEDQTRQYHPSSPTYGRGNPKSQTEGDNHYWGVFHDEEPFSMYAKKSGRFSSEYGFQSMACYDTYRESFDYLDLKLGSAALNLHQKSPKGQRLMQEYMERDLPVELHDFRKFVYLTQLLQAEGMKIAMDAHRRNKPTSMGTLYWQANDCWPAASWSSMDSKRRWKAFQFYAQQSFLPTNISIEGVDSTAIKVWGVTDELTAKTGRAQVTIVDFMGNVLNSEHFQIEIPKNSSKVLFEKNIAELLKGAEKNKVAVVVMAEIDGKMITRTHYLVPFKNLDLPIANFDVKYEKIDQHNVKAIITAKSLLKNVLFEAKEIQHNPSDAYFDLLPGETKEVKLNFVKPFETVGALGIYVTTLNSFIAKGTLPVVANSKTSNKQQQEEVTKELTYEDKVRLARNQESDNATDIRANAKTKIEEIKANTLKAADSLNKEAEETQQAMIRSQKEQIESLGDDSGAIEKVKAKIQKEMDAIETDTEKAIVKLQNQEAKDIKVVENEETKLLESSKKELQSYLDKLAAEKVKADEKAHKELIKQKIKAKKEREKSILKAEEEKKKARIRALKEAERAK